MQLNTTSFYISCWLQCKIKLLESSLDKHCMISCNKSNADHKIHNINNHRSSLEQQFLEAKLVIPLSLIYRRYNRLL